MVPAHGYHLALKSRVSTLTLATGNLGRLLDRRAGDQENKGCIIQERLYRAPCPDRQSKQRASRADSSKPLSRAC